MRTIPKIDLFRAETIKSHISDEPGGISAGFVCDVCGYVYDPAVGDPENGVAPGTPWEEVPEDWLCPLCAVGKDQFSPEA